MNCYIQKAFNHRGTEDTEKNLCDLCVSVVKLSVLTRKRLCHWSSDALDAVSRCTLPTNMARRFALAAFLIFLGASPVAACLMKNLDPNDLVENTPVYSANGRFCVVVRWHEGLADFTSQLASAFFHMDDAERDVPPQSKTVIAALYESGTKSRRLVAEIPLDVEKTGDVLVPDSGRYLVVRGPSHGCDPGAREGDTLVTIYDAEGSRVGALKVEDVFTPSDVLQLSLGHVVPDCQLRHESQDQEVVVLSVYVPQQEGNEPRYEERRIDVATARRWKFRPFIVNGHPVKAAGEILFHFQDVDEETWQALLRNAPPSGE